MVFLKHDAAEDDGLAVPDGDLSVDFVEAEYGLEDAVWHVEGDEAEWACRGAGDGGAVVDEAFEFGGAGDDVEVDGAVIGADDWFDFEEHADVAHVEGGWGGWGDGGAA